MSADWKEISEAFSVASDLAPNEREPYLKSLREPVRREVLSLLEASPPEDFLERAPQRALVEALSRRISPLKVGQTITDFKLLEKIGEGSFGTVFRATQLSLGREVALKITPNIGREAQIMAHLEHESIVPVYSETIDTDGQLRFICMQYVSGPSLEQVLDKNNKPETKTLLRWGIQLADALSYAHQRGVFHLDIKPSNILLHPSNRPFLTDFNVSLSQQKLEGVSLAGGTKNFMSPEQEASLECGGNGAPALTEASDVFSLGQVLKVMSKETDLYLSWIIERCTAANPKDRIQTARELKELLAGCLENYEIQELLPRDSWYLRLAKEAPIVTLSFSILIPHFVGSLINISYNSMRIVSKLSAAQQATFENLLVILNPIIYGISITLMLVTMLPIFSQKASLPEIRKRTLRAPLQTALISFFGWASSAFLFPFGIHYLSEPLSFSIVGHFSISFLLSSMVAITYSALNAQYFLLASYYPQLFKGCKNIHLTASKELKFIIPKLRPLYYLSGTVPLIGAALMVIVGPESLEGQDYLIYRLLLGTFIGLGIGGIFYSMNSSRNLARVLSILTRGKE